MTAGRERRPHEVGSVEDVPDGHHVVIEVDGREIGVFNVGDRFYALPNACLHQNGPLCRGPLGGTLMADADSDWKPVWTLEGEVVRCPWHASEYKVTTGECLSQPGRRLPVYDVTVRDGRLWIMV